MERFLSGEKASFFDQITIPVYCCDVGVFISQVQSNEECAIVNHGWFLLLHL